MGRDTDNFNWTESHLSVVHEYVSKLSLDSDCRVLSLFPDEVCYRMPGSSTIDASSVASFTQELKEFFVVPKQHQLFQRDDVVDQNQLLAAFINLLLRLLHYRTGSVNSVKDRIDRLEKELRFLLAVVGDKSLICYEERGKVQNLLAEIEAVVNVAGSLVHSIVFSRSADPIFKTMDERFGILHKHMDSFKANVIEFSNQQPVITDTNANRKIAGEGSLFIVDSLLYDLEGLLNQEDNMIADVKDQIKVVWQELKFSQSLTNDIKLSQYSEAEDLKEPIMRIRDAAYEAEYLINSFWVGDAPFWYFSIRISHVLNKIKLLKTAILEIKKNYDIGASKLAKSFSAQLSSENKRSSKVDDIIVQNREKKLDSFSRYLVLRLFQLIIEWKKNKEGTRDTVNFNWTLFQLSLVHHYVSKLSLEISHFRLLSLVKLFKYEFCYFVEESSTIDANLVVSFVQEMKAFFFVPKQHQLFERDDVIEQNKLLAAFIYLLLRLLCPTTGSVNSAKDRVDCLEKELRFLLTVVGDKSLIDDEDEQVQNLLAEIEAVVNEAGSLVHSIVFSTFADPIFETMDDRLGVILKHMEFLKANITKFSNQQPVIAETNTNPKIAGDGSLFIVDSLLYDLQGLLNQEDNITITDVKDQIKVVWKELKFLHSLIKDIKASRYSEAEELKEPLMRSRDAAYEAEYLINSFLVGDAPFWYFSTRLSHVRNKIKILGTGIQEIKKNYDIGASKVLAKTFSAQLPSENKRSSNVDDIIVGFEERATYILGQLVGGNKHLQIICIFGMPGLGKTTFAKELYNHGIVKDKFDKCSWCVVSQTYHRKNLLSDILVSLNSELGKDKIQEEEGLVDHIHKSLKGRRYLIVMDDIWSSNAWYDLQRCFPDDGNGSRILFTSRNKDVAPPHSIIHELPRMSDEQCWELLKKKIFQNERCPPQLLGTGKEIARKCSGLPLAAVVLGGILSSMGKERSAWENVVGNLAAYIFSDQSNSMMQILELSYKHLPDHLKPCFLYFGTFPEDKKISVRELKWLWVAEGFVLKAEEKNAESVAEEYLMELIDKSLIIADERRKSDGGVKSCLVHDSLRELCLKRCKEENFLNLVDKNYIIYEKHHRLLFRGPWATRIIPFGLHIRSLLGSLPNLGVSFNMKLLRVLDLLRTRRNIDYSLDSIKHLVQLRYLAMRCNSPSTGTLAWIESLVNLEFLVVKENHWCLEDNDRCFEAVISSAIVKMMKLRYVNFIGFGSVGFEEDLDSFRTNNLEFLGYVSIEFLKDEEILKCSPRLRKLKCQCAALWVEETGTFRYPDFGFFTHLESLTVSFSISFFRPKMEDMYVAPPNLPLNIKKLTLSGLGLPWKKMSIIGGLPNLQVLKLGYGACVGEIWETSDDEFQQLTFLKLSGLDLVQWNVPCSQHFPKLRHLVLKSCTTLQEIPSEVGEIVTLQLIELKWSCRKSLLESARQIEREQRDNGNEELKVCLENSYRC